MKNYMEFFEQTSKTILFEKFATEDEEGKPLPNLARSLSEEEVTTGDFHKKIISELGVRSFEEFVEKFTPWVYEMIEPGETEGSVEIKYYLEKPKHYDETEMNPTQLVRTTLYELVNKLYEQRKNSGVPQLDFDFSDIAKILSPESQTEKIKETRKNLQYYMNKYYELEEQTPGVPSVEKKKVIKKLLEYRAEVQETYTQGSSAMLTLKLGDASNAILAIEKSDDLDEQGGTKYIGVPDYDEDGNLRFRKVEFKDEEGVKQIGVNPDQKLLEILKEDYETAAPTYMQNSPEITNLVLSSISTGLTRNDHNREFWLKRLETGQQEYKKWMENLAYTIAPLVEKFIGVKAFFENATVDGKLDSVLIVANSTASELVASDTVKKYLADFLTNVNREIKKKIWFGILPAISLGDEMEEADDDDDLDYTVDMSLADIQSIKEKKKKEKAKAGKQNVAVSSNDAKILLDVLENAGIMTFFNYKAAKKTCFGSINKEMYEKMRDRIRLEKGEYAICCLPNFTIIPEDQRDVIINKKLVDAKCQEHLVSLRIPAIYVEASYVAAGMVVGSQQKDMLLKKGFDVEPNLTNIRFNLEEKEASKKFQSNMCVENDLPVPRDLSEELMTGRFGFYFSDKRIPGDNGREITHCYVRNARTMAKNPETKLYEEMTNKLFRDFVIALLYGNEDKADPEYAGEIKNKDIQEWMDYAQANSKLVANALLKHNEKIMSSDNIEFTFEFIHAKNRATLKIKSN